ncbi:uncharacterized protein P7C70_g5524, partial [Phenoliferia sp. Uapishka_3]
MTSLLPTNTSSSTHKVDVYGGKGIDLDTTGHSTAITIPQHYSTLQPFLPVYRGAKIANPSALAFSAMGVSLYIVSIIALRGDGLKSLGIIPAFALGYAAIALLIAGIWEFPSGQTWGATVYISLSGFWAGLSLILSPWSGVAAAYAESPEELGTAIGQFFFAWFITFVIFTIAAHRSSGGLLIFLGTSDFMLLFFALSFQYPTHTVFLKAAGSFGIVGAFVAWYGALGSLLTNESSSFRVPVLGDFTTGIKSE